MGFPEGVRAWIEQRQAAAVEIVPGDASDYDVLAPLHYRAGRPATISRVLRAIDAESGVLAGVLVTSRPTLNAWWRGAGFGGRFSTGDKSADAARLNAELRTISRIIVDPRFRGLGVASGLVRACLRDADTRCTEAVSSLGEWCPFFGRAGMRGVRARVSPRDTQLLRSLGERDPAGAADRLLGRDASAHERALRVWARASASTRKHAAGPIREIAALASGSLLAPPSAYVFDAEWTSPCVHTAAGDRDGEARDSG